MQHALLVTQENQQPQREEQTISAGYPLQVVSVDMMGLLLEKDDGSRYVLVAVDCFIRWAEVYGIPNQEASMGARRLVDEMFFRCSPPEKLHSDKDRQFESEFV